MIGRGFKFSMRLLCFIWLMLLFSNVHAICVPYIPGGGARVAVEVVDKKGDAIPFATVWRVALHQDKRLDDLWRSGAGSSYLIDSMRIFSKYHRVIQTPSRIVNEAVLIGLTDASGHVSDTAHYYTRSPVFRPINEIIMVAKRGYAPAYVYFRIGPFRACSKVRVSLDQVDVRLGDKAASDTFDEARRKAQEVYSRRMHLDDKDVADLRASQKRLEALAASEEAKGNKVLASEILWYMANMPSLKYKKNGDLLAITRFNKSRRLNYLVRACEVSCRDPNMKYELALSERSSRINSAWESEGGLTEDDLRSINSSIARVDSSQDIFPGILWLAARAANWVGESDLSCGYIRKIISRFPMYRSRSELAQTYFASLSVPNSGDLDKHGYGCDFGADRD